MHTLLIALVAVASLGQAQPHTELTKMLPSDGYEWGLFGSSTAIDGSRVFVGAPYDDENGSDSGAVYVYALGSMTETLKLHPGDSTASQFFGWDIQVGENHIAISAMIDSYYGPSKGSVYLYDRDSLVQVGRLGDPTLPESGRLGRVMDLDGTYLVTGSPDDNTVGSFAGSAHVFDLSTGKLLHKFLPPYPDTGVRFGSDVAVGNGLVLASTYWEEVDGLNRAGAVYVYAADSGDLLARLVQPDPGYDDEFGRQVEIGDGKIFVSAPNDFVLRGTVYVFDAVTLDYITQFTGSSVPVAANFGTRMTLHDGTLAVGISTNNNNPDVASEAVYLIDITTLSPIGTLVQSDAEVSETEWFGGSIAIDETHVVVGAIYDDDLGTNSGSAYLYEIPQDPCNLADLADPLGLLDLADVNTFASAFIAGDPLADIDGSTLLDLGDINLFVTAFNAGCP